jgi:hypothetical protein
MQCASSSSDPEADVDGHERDDAAEMLTSPGVSTVVSYCGLPVGSGIASQAYSAGRSMSETVVFSPLRSDATQLSATAVAA